jgi:hypothetical protein
MSRTIRVSPRKTNATPDDALAVVGRTPTLWDKADKVQVSVTFDWDREKAEKLAHAWGVVAPVEIGGPAMGTMPGDFEPGVFLKHGYTITSRGARGSAKHALSRSAKAHCACCRSGTGGTCWTTICSRVHASTLRRCLPC